MKPRFAIYALVLVLVILVAVFWRRPVQHPAAQESAPTSGMQATDEVLPTSPPAASAASQAMPGPAPTPVSSPATPTLTDEERRRLEAGQRAADETNVPLGFHGLVIDQDSNALAGVVVKVNVRHWAVVTPDVPSPDLSKYRFERATGADGRFEVNGVTGDGFDLESITKAGYEAEPTKRGFGATEGSYDKPVVFKMWNTNIHEQLITGHKNFDIVPDGRPYVVDLTKGTIAESGAGDMKVWIKYPLQVVRGETYDWSCQIDVINGGLAAPDINDSMFVAPTEGYTPSFQLQQQIKGGQRGSIGGQRRFYVRLNNGQEYGRMEIGLYAPFNNETPGLVSVSYAINPSGSRILR